MSKLNRGIRGVKVKITPFYTATGLTRLYAVSLLYSDGLCEPCSVFETEEGVRAFCKSIGVTYD